MKTHPTLARLGRLVGTWDTEATHPALPGAVIRGTTTFAWLEGRRFLVERSHMDHPDFPDGLTVTGPMDQDRAGGDAHDALPEGELALRAHYYDSRGVFRDNEARITDATWEWSREAPGFSQRFTGTFADGGDTIVGKSQLRRDDVHWKDDLAITYRRRKGA